MFGIGAGNDDFKAQRGVLILDDLFYNADQIKNDKIFNHVAIDRFTGGAIDGALFSEEVSQLVEQEGNTFDLKISVQNWKKYLANKEEMTAIEEALENSLKDICRGLLPLGGMTTKGHGVFLGTLSKNGTPILSTYKKSIK